MRKLLFAALLLIAAASLAQEPTTLSIGEVVTLVPQSEVSTAALIRLSQILRNPSLYETMTIGELNALAAEVEKGLTETVKKATELRAAQKKAEEKKK